MKRQDILLIAIVVIISVVLSLVVSRTFLVTNKQRSQQVEKVEPISADFPTPDKAYFNANAVDPTALIRIGDNTNPAPFNQSQ